MSTEDCDSNPSLNQIKSSVQLKEKSKTMKKSLHQKIIKITFFSKSTKHHSSPHYDSLKHYTYFPFNSWIQPSHAASSLKKALLQSYYPQNTLCKDDSQVQVFETCQIVPLPCLSSSAMCISFLDRDTA